MRDPHVVSLTYHLETGDTVTFDAPPLVHEADLFTLRLEDDVLTVEMKEHFAKVEDAREAVEPLLTSWEAYAALANRNEITFEYKDAEVIDRDPPKPGDDVVLRPDALIYRVSFSEPSIHITRPKYPQPPEDFESSPEVEALLERYRCCLEGREKLIPMANFCYTVIKGMAGSKSAARKQFNGSGGVLTKLGELTARGDLRTARKWRGEEENRSLTSAEENWLKEAVRLLILRLGEYNANPDGPFEKITMDDLPGL